MITGTSRYAGLLLLSAIAWTALACKPSPRGAEPERERMRDAATEVEDAGPTIDAGSDAGAPAADGGEAPVIGLDFLPLETRTSDAIAQTVAHMELTGLAFLPDDGGLLVWEKSGRISHYRERQDELILQGQFSLTGIELASDCGLISVAPDPDWQTNGFIYAAYCQSRTHSRVTRYVFRGEDYEQVADSGVQVIEFGDSGAPKAWHNAGSIGFFDDAQHSLWILAGEKDNAENAQDPSKNLGAVLRIIPSRGAQGGYSPHPENPFGGLGSDPTRQSSPDLYAWGLRSPWRGAIDASGRIWVGDVGELVEEINVVSAAGQNFGWGKVEGPCTESSTKPPNVDCTQLNDPVASWGRSSDHHYRVEDTRAAPTTRRVAWVGAPYRAGPRDPYAGYLNDANLISDMCIGFVRALSVDSTGHVTRDENVGHLVGLSGAAQAADGHLYVTSFGSCLSETFGVGGGVYRVVPRRQNAPEAEPPAATEQPLVEAPLGAMPRKLSATGIFADDRHEEPIARAVAYEPSLQLWSNGATKSRWLLLPRAARIDNRDREHWKFPTGTLLFKTFAFERGQRVETRVMRKTPDGWDFQAYVWRGDDADLLALEREVPAVVKTADGDLKHMIPSRFDCRSCHESNDDAVIGFDELRLNARLSGDAPATQLEELAARGVFEEPLPSEPDQISAEDPRTAEVLGYLHGNCVHCHNGSTRAMSKLDLHHRRALANLIGVPTEGSGQAAGIRVFPGSPERSILFQALSRQGTAGTSEIKPMPPIGVQLRDADAIALVRDWIAGLSP